MALIKASHVGRLHEALGVPKDKPIPWAAKVKASNSSDPKMAKMGQFAVNFGKK
jgi:hypothetical protein